MKEPKCKRTPADFWPPINACLENVSVYRLVKSRTELLEDDFLASIDADIKENKLREGCVRDDRYYGVSVFEELDDVKALLLKVPHFKTKFEAIANGITKDEDGCIRRDKRNGYSSTSHLTWWLFENAKPETYFVIVEEF